MINKINYSLINYSYLVIIIPLLLIAGPFFPDLLLSITAIFFLINILTKKIKFEVNNFFLNILIIFFIYLLINYLVNSSWKYSVTGSLFYFRFILFAMCISYFSLNNKTFNERFYYLIYFCILIIALDGYFQFYNGYNTLGFESFCVRDCNVEAFKSLRLTGFFNKPILGSYIARFLPILLCLFFLVQYEYKKKLSNKFLAIIVILSSGVVYLSGERTSFFLFMSFVMLFVLITNYSKKYKFIIISGISILIILITIFSSTVRFRMLTFTLMQMGFKTENIIFLSQDKDIINFISKSIYESKEKKYYLFSKEHDSHFKSAYYIFLDNIFFGSGLKSFRHVCKQYIINSDSCTTHPHNLPIQFLSELGLVGFLFYLFSIITAIFSLVRTYLNKTKLNDLDNARICIISGILISLFPFIPNGNFFNNWLSIIFFIMVGLLFTILKRKENV